jgi:two-component system, LytTR family, sensor kinase
MSKSPVVGNDREIDRESYGSLLRKAVLAWTVVGLIMYGEDIARILYLGGPHPYREGLYWLVRCVMSALLTPYIVWGVRLWPIEMKNWPGRLSLHLFLSITFGLVRAAMESMLVLPLHAKEVLGTRPAWAETALGVFAVLTLYSLVGGMVAYWAILSMEATKRYYKKFQERAREAMQLQLHASELQAQVAQAQLGALKMQLQPHFLFNTLNAMVVLVRQQKAKQAEEALTRFSDLLRAVLVDIEAQEVPLYRELEYVQLYLSIEQMRFPDRLKVQMDVDSSILDAIVPHMGLQPLAENAIRHGIAPRANGGTITIQASLDGKDLQLVIVDDGVGFDAARFSAGLGLKNLRSRLEQLYSGRARLIVASSGEGTSVRMVLPYRTHVHSGIQPQLVQTFVDEARVHECLDRR